MKMFDRLMRIFKKHRRSAEAAPFSRSPIDNINSYGQQLTDEEIADNKHRHFVGGLWDELGVLQFEFLKQQGLMPDHKLIDIGCGSLRGGIHFVRYLDRGNYYGLDINASLIKAGEKELEEAGLTDKKPNLLVDSKFDMARFGATFDYALSVSVFTHLPMNHIIRCLVEMRKVLAPEGKYFSTFFEAPLSAYLARLKHDPGDVVTDYDMNPFHYSFDEFEWMAKTAGLSVSLIGDWKHPRDQRMLVFSLSP